MMRIFRRKENKTSKRFLGRFYGLDCWPDDVVGWLRIPSMIIFLVGFLGIAKYNWPMAAKYLKTLNLPPAEFCWLMLIAGGTMYLLCVICWLCFEDIARIHRPGDETAVTSGQWRSM